MGLLMMLATGCGVSLAFILLIFASWKKIIWLRDFLLGAVVIWFAVYAVVLFGISLSANNEEVLDLDQAMVFGEI